MLDDYLRIFDLCYFEVTEAFKGLEQNHVWERPTPQLLSVGELAGHVAYWEAVRFGGGADAGSETPNLEICMVQSPLLDARFAYYPKTLAAPPSHFHLEMTAEKVCNELLRIHQESMTQLKTLNPNMNAVAPFWQPNSNYGELLRYAIFHVSYHTGQMYSVRHLLGEETPDN
jgi:hypothetical protein